MRGQISKRLCSAVDEGGAVLKRAIRRTLGVKGKVWQTVDECELAWERWIDANCAYMWLVAKALRDNGIEAYIGYEGEKGSREMIATLTRHIEGQQRMKSLTPRVDFGLGRDVRAVANDALWQRDAAGRKLGERERQERGR